jgi:UDP-galactopyranose mutase
MPKDCCGTIILGAGLAGLSAAHHGGGKVCEKSDVPAGMCISPHINGYTFDLGIHVLHTRNEYVLKLLQQHLGLAFNQQRRSAWTYSYDTLTRYPFQANTFGLPVPVVKECLLSFIDAWRKKKERDSQDFDNYEDWVKATFGTGIADHFMIPYSQKFWTVPPSEMTTDWMDVRIPVPKLEEVIEGALASQEKGFGPNAVFRYPSKRGIAAIPEAFVENGIQVNLNMEAVRIDLGERQVRFSDGTVYKYDVLISTIPIPELVTLVDAPQEIISAVEHLQYNSIMCVNLGIDRNKITDSHWIYYPEKKFSFFRISFLMNFASSMAPVGKSSISAEVAYSGDRPIDKDNITDIVIKDLIEAKVLRKDDRIELVDLRDIEYAYVIYDHNRSKNVSKIKSFFKEHAVILAGRYGSWEYQWMDDAILDGKRAAEEAAVLSSRSD